MIDTNLADKSLLQLRESLVQFKNQGGEQEDALKVLKILLESYKDGDMEYDTLLELMDFASGYCVNNLRIW